MALVTNSREKIIVDSSTIQDNLKDNNHVKQVQNQIKTKTYSLDIDKVLQNKLESAKRTDISYKMTGGGLTVTLDLATFEFFIAAISSYYQCYPLSAGEITFQSEHDRRGVLVQKTFKVQLKNSESCTINAYTTKATLLINGKSITHFIENELPTIHHMICNTYVKKEQLQYIMDNRSTNNNMKAKCRKCNRNVITRAVQCNNCQMWVHYRCEGLRPIDIDKIENNNNTSYTCSSCPNLTSIAIESTCSSTSLQTSTCETGSISMINTTQKCLALLNSQMVTSAEILLNEERIKQICSNCDSDIQDSHETVCDSCNNVVHFTCIAQNCTPQKCEACFGLEIQDEQVKKVSSDDTLKELDNDHDDTTMKTPYGRQTETPSICFEDNIKIVVLEDTESESKRTDANSPVQNCCHQKCVTETDNLLLAMRERMTKFILRKVDAQITQLESEQIPVQSTVINNMLPKGNKNESFTKEHVHTSTSTEHRGTVRNSEAIPLATNVIRQPPHPPPAINVAYQPPQNHVSQPLQSQYYTPSNKEGKAMQQHQPPLPNNSNMFISGKTLTQRKLVPAETRNVNSDFKVYHLNILSFNCKNIKTCDPLFSEILFNYDIVLLQEHWLFDCQLPLLDNIHSDFNGVGKAVDSDDPLPPTHLPRGYGGACILWKKSIDHIITKVDCTNNRIQCIEITNTCGKDILVISVYMPCKDNRVKKLIEFVDCIEQLHSLFSQYNNTHHIAIGGDIKENIIDKSESKRYVAVRALIDDHCLYTIDLGPTFVNYKHEEISSIDYILLDKELFENNSSYLKLDSCSSLVSDHYPITCRLNIKIEHRQQSTKTLPTNRKIKRSTIDVNLYEKIVNKSLPAISSEIQSGHELTKVMTQVNTIMKNAAIESAPRSKVYRRKKQKPKIRSFKTNHASKRCKEAFAKWKANERPTSQDNKIYCDMKFAKYELRKTCRIEIALKVLNDRQEILDARTKHDQICCKLLGKKKGKLKNCISELKV
ncbi:unnamed protein product [Mytilus coruscus]|uniref:Zinc finger PHD-type domain-containing protein n=1 Tax=Mytilus coruscus TaxID=42192 RepID=A0A6J8BA98_MYTCO|nr:unnamed protein product [Mytilus coruscus]